MCVVDVEVACWFHGFTFVSLSLYCRQFSLTHSKPQHHIQGPCSLQLCYSLSRVLSCSLMSLPKALSEELETVCCLASARLYSFTFRIEISLVLVKCRDPLLLQRWNPFYLQRHLIRCFFLSNIDLLLHPHCYCLSSLSPTSVVPSNMTCDAFLTL